MEAVAPAARVAEVAHVRAARDDVEFRLLRERLELLDSQRSLAAVHCQKFANLVEAAVSSQGLGEGSRAGFENHDAEGDCAWDCLDIAPTHMGRCRRASMDAAPHTRVRRSSADFSSSHVRKGGVQTQLHPVPPHLQHLPSTQKRRAFPGDTSNPSQSSSSSSGGCRRASLSEPSVQEAAKAAALHLPFCKSPSSGTPRPETSREPHTRQVACCGDHLQVQLAALARRPRRLSIEHDREAAEYYGSSQEESGTDSAEREGHSQNHSLSQQRRRSRSSRRSSFEAQWPEAGPSPRHPKGGDLGRPIFSYDKAGGDGHGMLELEGCAVFKYRGLREARQGSGERFCEEESFRLWGQSSSTGSSPDAVCPARGSGGKSSARSSGTFAVLALLRGTDTSELETSEASDVAEFLCPTSASSRRSSHELEKSRELFRRKSLHDQVTETSDGGETSEASDAEEFLRRRSTLECEQGVGKKLHRLISEEETVEMVISRRKTTEGDMLAQRLMRRMPFS